LWVRKPGIAGIIPVSPEGAVCSRVEHQGNDKEVEWTPANETLRFRKIGIYRESQRASQSYRRLAVTCSLCVMAVSKYEYEYEYGHAEVRYRFILGIREELELLADRCPRTTLPWVTGCTIPRDSRIGVCSCLQYTVTILSLITVLCVVNRSKKANNAANNSLLGCSIC
jgi:hypothetical protein